MIKAKAGNTLIFGLSDMNITKLKEGKPIMVDLADLGTKGRVIIFHAPTENDMKKALQDFIGPNTKVTDSRH